ncbi:polyphosphate kinase 1 [Deminuibacter soli]|uniref:Polyphosphate kinase n=1 Tax=Deminuibacter soli TaxID=2291815 RepID=A0A3E1NM82_9BACT|nr:polyphosphate kinase 1 [Deminuibacter soli]RFM28928.1 polyphosphate kinase 1 [Deminuibacter soli]
MTDQYFYHRDLSWLSFNERVLLEATRENVPLLERIKFLSIYSSNLDEFYRVRIPVQMALTRLKQEHRQANEALAEIFTRIDAQQHLYGTTLREVLIPALEHTGNILIYRSDFPEPIREALSDYFFSQVLCFLQPVWLKASGTHFFPANNQLYLMVLVQQEKKEKLVIINVPSDTLPRFATVDKDGKRYIVFLEDIIKFHLPHLFQHCEIKGAWNCKITRDAELNLEDEYHGDLAAKIERQLTRRDQGFATRFLYEPGLPLRALQTITHVLHLEKASVIAGGAHHNLKDLNDLPVSNSGAISYQRWPQARLDFSNDTSIFNSIQQGDRILHVPYQSYNPVLRFFNEAATDPAVTDIYVTLYRVARDSRIVNALISAAANGKKVTVFVELKARFDEANNLKWGKKMKAAGIRIIYSIPGLKVHAKIALVKKEIDGRSVNYCLLATGNFNEGTARFYTDHILFTANKDLAREMELLFIFLTYRKHAGDYPQLQFRHLLVAQFNLQQTFLNLVDREIANAKAGKPSGITIKLNNLEEKVLIAKLYEASTAGVPVRMIVRSICCLVPGVPGMSENIHVTRIVDRYLEHGRIFIFHNNGDTDMYMGSADWMNRNIYHRIEVCFPVYDAAVKKQISDIISIQLSDNTQAVRLNETIENIPIVTEPGTARIASQEAIHHYVVHRS